MAIEFNIVDKHIEITSPQTEVLIQDLLNAAREFEASEAGIVLNCVISASGKESLGGGVSVGITAELCVEWQVHFWEGNYIAKVSGGNLVGGVDGDPIAYSAGVQTLLIQSAASTIVTTGGSALTTEEHDRLFVTAKKSDLYPLF
jgi:hypothetical protein